MAAELLLFTGQHRSDVYRMTWADIIGDAIRVAQQKTAAKLTIPIHEALHRVLSTANRSFPTVLVMAYGEQFPVKGFGQMISAAIPEAGLPERCKAHGLRKAATRRLAVPERWRAHLARARFYSELARRWRTLPKYRKQPHAK